jgi:hypothetical protein
MVAVALVVCGLGSHQGFAVGEFFPLRGEFFLFLRGMLGDNAFGFRSFLGGGLVCCW